MNAFHYLCIDYLPINVMYLFLKKGISINKKNKFGVDAYSFIKNKKDKIKYIKCIEKYKNNTLKIINKECNIINNICNIICDYVI